MALTQPRAWRQQIADRHTTELIRAEHIPDDIRAVVDSLGPATMELAEQLRVVEAHQAAIADAMTAQAESTARALAAVLDRVDAVRHDEIQAYNTLVEALRAVAAAAAGTSK